MKKSRTFTSRLTAENRALLASIAREHFDGKLAPALDYLFDIYRGKPARPTLQPRVADVRQLELFASRMSDFCERMDRVAARVAAPMPASGDETLATLVRGWRHDSAKLRAEAHELTSEAWLVRRSLLGTVKLDVVVLKRAAAKWTDACDQLRKKAEAKTDRTGFESAAQYYAQYVPLWTLFHQLGLVDRPAPAVQSPQTLRESSPSGELPAVEQPVTASK